MNQNCAAVTFGIESVNIVGYTTTDTAKGAQQMAGASFVSVGSEALDIQDIVPQGDNAEGGTWIKWWDPVAKKYSANVYYVYEMYDPETDATLPNSQGWADADWYPIEKTFAPGEGFWFQAANDNVKIVVSGQVDQPTTQYLSLPLTKGAQRMVQNPFPTDLDIQDIVLDGDNAEGGSWIKWWDPVAKKYGANVYYVYEMYDPETDATLPNSQGWADADWYPIEKTFSVGDGFWVQSANDGVDISFPNPFYPPPPR